METEEIMLQIQDTLVTLDLAEQFFCCDLDKCLGECCIEGDAGAPITKEEYDKLEKIVPIVYDDLAPAAQREIDENGVGYVDEEGDLVTSIVDGKNCVFTCYAPNGMCMCAIEKAFREGRIKNFRKPASCYLYPVRITKYPTFTAVNYHRWKICRAAELLGKREGIRLYQFLKGPLTEYFGEEWYDELATACEAYLEQYGS
jgi:hypothetical protein